MWVKLLHECPLTLDTSWDLLLSVEENPGAGQGTSRAANTCREQRRGERVPVSAVRSPGLVQSPILLIAEIPSLVGFNRLPLQFTCLHGGLVRTVQVKLLRASPVAQW